MSAIGIQIQGGITISGGGVIFEATPPTLVLSLDAAGYTTGPWIDSISSRSFTLYGGVTHSTDGGGSFVFDPASSQYGECTSSLSDLNTWTVEAWHYYAGTNTGIDAGAAGACIVTEVYPGSTNKINYSLGNDRAALPGSTLDGLYSGFFDTAWETTDNGVTLTAGNWYQIIGTYDGRTNKLYINNTLASSIDYTGTPVSSQGGIRLMRRWDNADYWGGKLAIVNIYNGGFNVNDVAISWNANRARFGL
jgi:Concanavalin A-like lectin/glucanases superfamily